MEESKSSKDSIASVPVVAQISASDINIIVDDKETDQTSASSVSESIKESPGTSTGTVEEVSKDEGAVLESVKETDVIREKERQICSDPSSEIDNSKQTDSVLNVSNEASTEGVKKSSTSCNSLNVQKDKSDVQIKEISVDVNKELAEKTMILSSARATVESDPSTKQANTNTNNKSVDSCSIVQQESPVQETVSAKAESTPDSFAPSSLNSMDIEYQKLNEQHDTDGSSKIQSELKTSHSGNMEALVVTDSVSKETLATKPADSKAHADIPVKSDDHQRTDKDDSHKPDKTCKGPSKEDIADKSDTSENNRTEETKAKENITEPSIAFKPTLPESTPAAAELSTPAVLESATPAVLISATPAAPESITPAAPESKTPAAPESATPAAPESASPAALESATPAAQESTTPVVPESATPAAQESTTPAAPESATPAAPESAAHAAQETMAPAAPKTTAPAAPNLATPAAPESATPAAPESTAPAASESTTPAAPKSATLAAPESATHAASESATHAAPELAKHAASESATHAPPESATPAAPESTTLAAPELITPALPESTTHAAPESTTHAAPESATPAAPESTTPSSKVPSTEDIERSAIMETSNEGGIGINESSSATVLSDGDLNAAKDGESHQVVTIVEQIDEISSADGKELNGTDGEQKVTEVESNNDMNANNNAKGAAEKEGKKVKDDVKGTTDSLRMKEESGKPKIGHNKSNDTTKSEQKPVVVVGKKADEPKPAERTGASSIAGSKKDGPADVKDIKNDAKQDSRDLTRDIKPSKSYSAQRTVNRAGRKVAVAVADDRKDKKDSIKEVSETKRKEERSQEEDRRDRDVKRKDQQRDRGKMKEDERSQEEDRRDRDVKRKDQLSDRGKTKEAERFSSDKSKGRDDKRDKKSSLSSYETKKEREDAERKRREEERRKREDERRRKEDDRKKKEEDRKRKEEERKIKEEERKKQEEEDRKRAAEQKIEDEKKRKEAEQKRLEEEAVRQKEEEERQAREISVEAVEKKANKMDARATNLAASEIYPDESFFTRLDSSLKKNTAFVKKLRVMTESNRLALKKEFNTLNLTKYVAEVATSIAEAKLKMSDISCAIYICSLVHQRYADFSGQMLQAMQKVLPAVPSKKDKEKDEQKIIVFDSKIRVELRFLAELIVAGVFTEKEGFPLLNGVLSTILHSDKESHSNLPIITSFTKHCGEDFAGFVPRKHRLIAEKFSVTVPTSEVFSTQVKNAYRNLLRDHYTSVTKYLLRKHNDLQNFERQNMRMLQTKGELSDERQKRFEETQAIYQKLLMNTSTFSDLIDEDMPDLPIDEKLKEENELMGLEFYGADGSTVEFDFETSLWEDEDTRTFHENLIDLRTMVPAILFKDSEKRAAPGDQCEKDLDKFDEDIEAMEVSETAQEAEMTAENKDEETDVGEDVESKEEAMVEDVESGEPDTEEPDEDEEEEEEEEEVTTHNVSMKVMLDAYLLKLPQCVNRDFIDREAVEFCMNLNTKSNRKKLVKALYSVPRTRLDLLPFYSRLVATLYPCMPDIATDLVEKLKADFRWHMRKKDQMKIESKVKIVRFLGELTKFKMCPKADTLHCLKQLLLVFQHHNIEMACNLLDVCGRYLYRSKDSHLRTKALLDLMMRKKNKMHLNERHGTMVENAFFYCNPPESKAMEQKVRPPLHEYIRKLLFKDLTKVTVERVLKQMRKLPWNDLVIQRYAVKCLSSVWFVKYNNVHCMANLLAGLVLYHDYVGIQVVDTVLEDIRMGMEINNPKFNQRRVSVAKYLGELYNYRMLESSVIFKTLYSFIRFGVSLDPEMPSMLDPPEHLFRIRLSCTLLDTCGQFFDRGTSKKKLDFFLVYFQQYILYKRSLDIWNPETRPFPLDADNAIADTFDCLRPKLTLFTTLDEANADVDELEKEFVQKLGNVINLARAAGSNQTEGGGPLSTITEVVDEGSVGSPASGRRLSFATGTEDEYDSDSDMDSEDVRRPKHHLGNSQSQGLSQNTDEGRYDTDENFVLESAGENEDDDRVTVLTGGPKLVECEEDEDFTSAFDKMMSENLQQRTVEAAKVPQLDIGVPLQAKVSKPKKTFDLFNPTEVEDHPMSTMNFTLMTRSGKKQQYHEFEVPLGSELAVNLRNTEMAEMAEKQRMKELTLHINDRQEEEDYQELMASLQKPAIVAPPGVVTTHQVTSQPREPRKSRFHHPKGAPDADQIFHQTGNRKW